MPIDLAAVYEEFREPIRKYALRLSRDPNLAEDITADVFAKLTEQVAAGGGPQTNGRSYLYQTAYHLVIDHARQNNRTEPLELASNRSDRETASSASAEGDPILKVLLERCAQV